MSPDYNKGSFYATDEVEVTFVYTDYEDDEEPEAQVVTIEGWKYAIDIISKVKKMFTPIEILDIRAIEEKGE